MPTDVSTDDHLALLKKLRQCSNFDEYRTYWPALSARLDVMSATERLCLSAIQDMIRYRMATRELADKINRNA